MLLINFKNLVCWCHSLYVYTSYIIISVSGPKIYSFLQFCLIQTNFVSSHFSISFYMNVIFFGADMCTSELCA